MVEKVKIIFDELTHKQYDSLVKYLASGKSENLQNGSGIVSINFCGDENPPLYREVSVQAELYHAHERNNSLKAINGLLKKVLSDDNEE